MKLSLPQLTTELKIVLVVSMLLASFYPLINLAVFLNSNPMAFTQGEFDEGMIQTGYVTQYFNYAYPFDPQSGLYTPVLSYNIYWFFEAVNFLNVHPYPYNYLLVFLFSAAYLVSLYYVIRLLANDKDALNIFLLVCLIPSLAGAAFIATQAVELPVNLSFSYGPGSLTSYALIEGGFTAMATKLMRLYYLVPFFLLNLGIIALYKRKPWFAATALLLATLIHPVVGGAVSGLVLAIIAFFKFDRKWLAPLALGGAVGLLPWVLSAMQDPHYFLYYAGGGEYARVGAKPLILLFDFILLFFLAFKQRKDQIILLAGLAAQAVIGFLYIKDAFSFTVYAWASFIAFAPIVALAFIRSEKEMHVRVLFAAFMLASVLPGSISPFSGTRFLTFLPIAAALFLYNDRVRKALPALLAIGAISLIVFTGIYYNLASERFLKPHDDIAVLEHLQGLPQGVTVSPFNYTTLVAYVAHKQPFYAPTGAPTSMRGSAEREPAVQQFLEKHSADCAAWEKAGVRYAFVDSQRAFQPQPSSAFTLLKKEGSAALYAFDPSTC